MASTAVAAYGMYPDRIALNQVLKTLNQGGFSNEKICMMMSPVHPIASVVREAKVLGDNRQASAVTAGLIGWLSEFGAVVIPTVGFFVRSCEFFDAIVEGKSPMGRCGGSSTLEGLGFPPLDAERLERQIKRAGVLVYISCRDNSKAKWALDLLSGTGAAESGALNQEELVTVRPEVISSFGRSASLGFEA